MPFVPLACTLLLLLADAGRLRLFCLRSPAALAAENLLLRTRLAPYQERHVTPRHAIDATRVALAWLGRWLDWLATVQPATFTRWHHQGFGTCEQ
jgi:hypothetical protein